MCVEAFGVAANLYYFDRLGVIGVATITQLRRCVMKRTSDGGNGNHSVSLPIILIKIKVDQMLPSSYISSLLVYIL